MNKRIKKKQQKRMKVNRIHPNVEVTMIDVSTFSDFDVMDAETACSIMNHPSDLKGVPAEDIVAMTTAALPPLDKVFTATTQKELSEFFHRIPDEEVLERIRELNESTSKKEKAKTI